MKWVVRVTNFQVESSVLNVVEWESVFGLIQDLQLTVEQSQMVKSD